MKTWNYYDVSQQGESKIENTYVDPIDINLVDKALSAKQSRYDYNVQRVQTAKSFKYCFDAVSMPHIEYEDKKEKIDIKKRGETESLATIRNVKILNESSLIKDKPLFRFFLDGSRITYKVDDLRYGRRLYLAVAGQIGIACCERKNKDIFIPYEFKKSMVISIPERANSGSHKTEFFFNNLLAKLNEHEYLKKRNIQFDKNIALY